MLLFVYLEAASSYMSDRKYKEALLLWKTIIIQEKSSKKIFPMFLKARCEIESGLNTEAVSTCRDIARLIVAKVLLSESDKEIKLKCHDEVESLVNKLIEINKIDTALLMLQRQFYFINHSFNDAEKLDKLEKLGTSMFHIVKRVNIHGNPARIKECCTILNEILHVMQLVSNVDTTTKTHKISMFTNYYGFCCNILKLFSKSIEIYLQLIFYVKSNLGNSAPTYQVYGHSHHNLADALRNTNRFKEAKSMLEKALKIYEMVTDWLNDQQKADCVSNTTRLLHEVNIKLQTQNYKILMLRSLENV